MTDFPPHLVASINRINAALELAFDEPPPATGTLRVCVATEEEWNAFVDCDGEVVHLKYLEWFADTGEIHIIEFVDKFSRPTNVSRPELRSTPKNSRRSPSSRNSHLYRLWNNQD
ncbi:hypothetical protein AeNC1_016522 [Aphanomyces euteiches]|nr:hypothetical protein AeNC1_016522 [Aphanomyces euteiches]